MTKESRSPVLHFFRGKLNLPPGSTRETVLRNLTLLGSGTVIAQFLMAVNAILLARQLKPEAYGIFAATYAAVGLSSFFFNWGLDTWLLRQASIEKDPDKSLGIVIALKLSFGLLWVVALFILLPISRPGLYIPALVLVACIDVLVDGLFSAGLANLNGQARVRQVSRLLVLSRGSRLLNTVLLLALRFITPLPYALARLAGTLFSWIVSLRPATPRFEGLSTSSARKTFVQSVPYGLSDLLSLVYLQADILLIAWITGSSRLVGLYAPASGIISALFVIPTVGFYVLVPVLTSLYAGDRRKLRGAILQIFTGFSILGLCLWLVVWIGSNFLARSLLGEAYAVTGQILAILSPILFTKTVSFAAAAFLLAVNWQSRRLIPQAIAAILNISLNLLAINLFGITGAAVVYVISETVLLLGYLVLTTIWFRKHPDA